MNRTSILVVSVALALPMSGLCQMKFTSPRRSAARRATVQKGATQASSLSSLKKDFESVCKMGRNLYVGIIQANTEREAAGLEAIWPRTPGSKLLSNDKDDIAGMGFNDAATYFAVLFDVKKANAPDWAPYVNVDRKCKDAQFTTGCGWNVVANVTDSTPESIPALITANVDPQMLVSPGDPDEVIPFGSRVGRGGTVWADSFVIVIRKGGALKAYSPAQFSRRNVLGGTLPSGVAYLKAPKSRNIAAPAPDFSAKNAPAAVTSSGSRWKMQGEQLVSFDDIVVASPRPGKRNDMYTVKLKKPYFIFDTVMVGVEDGRIQGLYFQAERTQLTHESMRLGDAIARDIASQCGIEIRSDNRRCHREYDWYGRGCRFFKLNVNNENDETPGTADFTLQVGCGASR